MKTFGPKIWNSLLEKIKSIASLVDFKNWFIPKFMCNFRTVHEVCRSRGHKIFLPNTDGHEMFLNLFDGPENIFLCSFVFLTLSKFI